MSTQVFIFAKNFGESLDNLCTCGHKLYEHAFVVHNYGGDPLNVWTSQCTRCGYIQKEGRFVCEGFVQKE